MTQKQRILDYIRENIRATAKEIAEALKIPQTSARARISEARKEGYGITKKTYEIFEEPSIISDPVSKKFYRKIVKTGSIISEKKGVTEVAWYYKEPISLYAVTYENNLIDRRQFLINKLQKEFSSYELPITYFETYGYDQEEYFTKYEIPNDLIYDGFEVGTE
jgi:DNA-binding Lrp family transcriptional regulator